MKKDPKAKLTSKCRKLGELFVEYDKPQNITIDQEKAIVAILKTVHSLLDGVGEAVATGAVIGGVAGAIGAYAQHK